MNALKRWDIFCKIVDNFGDIGVCWRLARQLQSEHGLQIRLWIDDLDSAQKIIPNLNLAQKSQVCEDISILKWPIADEEGEADFSQAADVVIEAFACELPASYLAAMARKQSKWVNLEYLSAEPWVADFHGKPSPQPQHSLIRYFYFPGFTEATGGLIRERSIIELNQQDNQRENNLKVSLFCYPHAPIHRLLTAMIDSNEVINCYVPTSSILPQIADFFGEQTIVVGDYLSRDNLHIHILPFLSQADYDKLLRDCDINFVRGEDSWVRAILAGKPFIWQPYWQTEHTHIKKLKAFIDVFYANCEQKDVLWKAHAYWSAEHGLQINFKQGDFREIWHNYIISLQAIKLHTKMQSQKLAQQTDLAAKLVIFCNKL